MSEFIHWFQVQYPEHKKALMGCNHNYDENDTNPYHVEGDCWSHTMMVCKVAELQGYDAVVQAAALLHDIGKPSSRTINPRNHHVQFFGHEECSATLAKPIVDALVQAQMLEDSEADKVLRLIEMHGKLHDPVERDMLEYYYEKDAVFLEQMKALRFCDSMGRFKRIEKYPKKERT